MDRYVWACVCVCVTTKREEQWNNQTKRKWKIFEKIFFTQNKLRKEKIVFTKQVNGKDKIRIWHRKRNGKLFNKFGNATLSQQRKSLNWHFCIYIENYSSAALEINWLILWFVLFFLNNVLTWSILQLIVRLWMCVIVFMCVCVFKNK